MRIPSRLKRQIRSLRQRVSDAMAATGGANGHARRLQRLLRRPNYSPFCGRTFTTGELELVRQITVEFSALGVTEISRTVCELLE